MIKSDVFYASFSRGLAETCALEPQLRRKGKIPKYLAQTAAGKVAFWFKVNSKASAIPFQAGEFWPVIDTDLRYNEKDDGMASWYQYADEPMRQAMLELQKIVHDKVAAQTGIEPEFWRTTRDISVKFMADFIRMGFREGVPHSSLYYLDEGDALAWGRLFGRQLPVWLERFEAAPESLDGFMWRVHWAGMSGI